MKKEEHIPMTKKNTPTKKKNKLQLLNLSSCQNALSFFSSSRTTAYSPAVMVTPQEVVAVGVGTRLDLRRGGGGGGGGDSHTHTHTPGHFC